MKLAYFEAQDGDEAKLKKALAGVEVAAVAGQLDEKTAEAAADAEMVSVFVQSELPKKILDKLPSLQMIATRSTGYDHVDMKECARRGIVVSNVPTYGENTVAEHAFALILALSRKIFQSFERTEKMDFDREGLEGFDLSGKTLGVIGCGNIGRHSVMIGRGFGMKVLVSDVHPDEEFARQTGCRFVDSLDELLEQSDVITVHVPFIPGKTNHLINKDNVKKIKRGAVLVNTARGGIVDTAALLWALEEGILAGAGLDVLEEEDDTFDHVALLSRGFSRGQDIVTLLRNHLLVERDDVIITPHNAFNSREARQRIFATTIENIAAFVKGKAVNIVTTNG